MPKLVVQMGHCYRRTGATGTIGEQDYATKVAQRAFALLNGKGGWTINTTLADENDYSGDAFVAVHCDGSTNTSARGASVGYRTTEGQQAAQAWKRAYAARGWPVFRADNYTTALSGYYGTRNAVTAGNRRAFIIECGFRTNSQDRALLDGPGGVDRVVLSIGDALGISGGNVATEYDILVENQRRIGVVTDIVTENQRRINDAVDHSLVVRQELGSVEWQNVPGKLDAMEKRLNDVYTGVSQILAKLNEGTST